MSTAIPPNPNRIIAQLLEVASAAYTVTHGADSRMIGDGSGKREGIVDHDDLGTMAERLWHLDRLPQPDEHGHLTGPARARRYLESFVEGEAITRLHAGGVVRDGLTVFPVLTAGAEVQRDGTEFKEHTWNAPATGPGFTPTAEFPASGPISHDFYTHRQNWREAIQHRIDTATPATVDSDEQGYWRHELRAFDRAFDSLPPQHERRLRERMIEPAIPVVGKEALVDATRPLFVKAMQAEGYRTDLDERGLYKGVSEYRWEGWKAAVEAMGFRVSEPEDIGSMREARKAMDAVCDALTKHAPGWQALTERGMDSAAKAIEQLATSAKNEIRTNMLADTADEALRIINDAGLLRDLHDLFDDPFTEVIVDVDPENGAWSLHVSQGDRNKMRTYQSISFHQMIALASKGERDLAQPEHEQCQFCGFTVETPCDTLPPAECPTAVAAQVASMPKPKAPTTNRREEMNTLLLTLKDKKDVQAAKNIIRAYTTPPGRMIDVPDEHIEAVIRACEEELKEVK